MNFKRNPQVWVGIILSIISLGALFFFINPSEIWAALKEATLWLVLVAFPLVAAHFALRALRWRYMLGNDLGYMTVFHNQNIGNMLNQILPLRLGDLGRAVLIGNTEEHDVADVLPVVAVERVLDVLAVLLLLPFTLSRVTQMPGWMTKAVWLMGIAAVVAFAVAIYAVHHQAQVAGWTSWLLEKIPFLKRQRWQEYVKKMLAGLESIATWRALAIIGLYSAAIWIPMIAAYWVVLRSLTANAHLLVATFAMVAGSLSIAAPSSPGQLGVYEAGVSAALVAAGTSRGIAASFAFLFHAVYALTIIGLGIMGLLFTEATLRNTIEATVEFFSSSDKSSDESEDDDGADKDHKDKDRQENNQKYRLEKTSDPNRRGRASLPAAAPDSEQLSPAGR